MSQDNDDDQLAPKLNPELAECYVKDLVETIEFTNILKQLDYNPDPNEIGYVCQQFNVSSVNELKNYEHFANKSQNYFLSLLNNYLKKENSTLTIQQLVNKLWNMKNCPIICSNIKKRENEILNDLKNIRNNVDNSIKIKFSVMSGSAPIVEYENRLPINGSGSYLANECVKISKKPIPVHMFYYKSENEPEENLKRIELLKEIIAKYPNVDLKDLSDIKDINVLKKELDKNYPVFLVFDERVDKIIDDSSDSNQPLSQDARLVKDFYKKLYYEYLNKDRNHRIFLFSMEPFTTYVKNGQTFKYPWLLRQSRNLYQTNIQNNNNQNTKFFIKPYEIPSSNAEPNQSNQMNRIIDLIENFRYRYMQA